MTRKQGKDKRKARQAKVFDRLILCGSSNHKSLKKSKYFSVPFPSAKIINRAQGGANVLPGTELSYSPQFVGRTGTEIEPTALYVLNLSFNELLKTADQLEACAEAYTFRTLQTLDLLFSYKLRKNQLLVGLPLPRLSVSLFQKQITIVQGLKEALDRKGIKSFDIFPEIPSTLTQNDRLYFKSNKDRFHFSEEVDNISATIISDNIKLFLKGAAVV